MPTTKATNAKNTPISSGFRLIIQFFLASVQGVGTILNVRYFVNKGRLGSGHFWERVFSANEGLKYADKKVWKIARLGNRDEIFVLDGGKLPSYYKTQI